MWIYRSIFAWVLHKMFKQRIRVSHVTFQYICENLSSKLKKQPTSMKDPISVKDKALGTMASMASIAIVLFLHNQRKFKNIPCFLALPENLAFFFSCNQSIHLKILQLRPLLFSSFDFEKNSSFLTTAFFSCLILSPTLAARPLFFYVGWLNSFSLIFTISIIFSRKFECYENTIKTCSPRYCAPSSLQGIFMCDAWKALPTS